MEIKNRCIKENTISKYGTQLEIIFPDYPSSYEIKEKLKQIISTEKFIVKNINKTNINNEKN